MIDIDVIGQLIPNPWTMLTQLCSTLVLFLCVKKFLWKSVQNMLKERSSKMQEELLLSEKAKKDAEEDRLVAKQELKAAQEKSQEMIEKATLEAKVVRDEIVSKAKSEADAQLVKARDQIEQEKVKMQSDMQREMVEIAMSAAEKLIASKTDEEADRKAVEAFVKEANSYGISDR